MKIKEEIGVAGYFKMEAVNAATGKRRVLADWFKNRILNAGLNYIGIYGPIGWCQVGTGSSAPIDTETTLQSYVFGVPMNQGETTGAVASLPRYNWMRRRYRFAPGEAVGNLSEVGVGWDNPGSLFSRSLIKDSEGNPTTITVLPDEYLDVTYELRVYSRTNDTNHTLTIGGVDYAVVLRPSLVTTNFISAFVYYGMSTTASGTMQAHEGPIGDITESPAGYISNNSGYSYAAYEANSYKRRITATFGLDYGNHPDGIGALYVVDKMGAFQMSVSPKIPKTALKVLNITFDWSWARYTG